ncbi:hypothetical protein [uncultured Hymenobacter sp.]|uniref:hypothetical protein n=1 Tax=uncultured Hymenobacter sp. TaxID=170016 RepID=UPI0035CB11CC
MATDGVKIIDGDLASDIYGTFMEMYDAGASIQEIKQAVEEPLDVEDGFDYEIYITAFALALWQTGQLTPEVIAEVEEAIERGAGVRVWTDELGIKEGQKRQRELTKLSEKLALPNPKIRKRRVYKPVTKFIFEENAVLVFRLPDGNYCATILMQIFQYQGRCHYHFIASTYKGLDKPTITDIENTEVLGRKVPSGLGRYQIGLDITAMGPKLLRSFSDKFEQIGILELRPECKDISSYRGVQSFEMFCWTWADFDDYIRIFRGEKIILAMLL